MNRLDKQFKTASAKIARTSLTPLKPNGQRPKKAANRTALGKRRRGVVRTERCSFEITAELKAKLDGHVSRQKAAGRPCSKSQLIRAALEAHLG